MFRRLGMNRSACAASASSKVLLTIGQSRRPAHSARSVSIRTRSCRSSCRILIVDSHETLQSPKRARTSIGFVDTSSFHRKRDPSEREPRRSRPFSPGSRRIDASAPQPRIRRSAPFCFYIAASRKANWNDVTDFEVIPAVTSAEAATALAPRL